MLVPTAIAGTAETETVACKFVSRRRRYVRNAKCAEGPEDWTRALCMLFKGLREPPIVNASTQLSRITSTPREVRKLQVALELLLMIADLINFAP